MHFDKSYLPYGLAWSSPFVRWQGSIAHLHSMRFAAEVAKKAFEARGFDPAKLESLHLGMTVPQKNSFYGAPWMAALLGAPGITGPQLNQACATSARVLVSAAQEIESGGARTVLALAADRCSNGPHLYYPNPQGMGGTGEHEDWVVDNFQRDPHALNAMIETAENVAREAGIDRAAQEELTLIRVAQYQEALANERAFQKRYMVGPLPIFDASGRKQLSTLEGDEGLHPTTKEGLAKLKPVMPNGSVTFGCQTHPADGNAGAVVCDRERAQELGKDPKVTVRLVSGGSARAKKGFMAMAVVPAAQAALKHAGIGIRDVAAIKTHNPIAVNDVYIARELGLDFAAFNRFGSPLVYGHPQGPTGLRATIELIEELVLKGGGYGLFAGCAAGDTAMALVVRVN
jgi:acetyl-CoA acetyltransferase